MGRSLWEDQRNWGCSSEEGVPGQPCHKVLPVGLEGLNSGHHWLSWATQQHGLAAVYVL